MTQVVTQKGETEYFAIEVGLHQGSAPSHRLFIIIMDVLTENIEKDPSFILHTCINIFIVRRRPGAVCYDS